VKALRAEGFDVMQIEDMELLTIRGYTKALFDKYALGSEVYVRQATQSTLRIVRKR
jgi:aspartate kinase